TPGVNFLGTPDNQPLELRVNNRTAFRLLPSSDVPNVVGGSLSNTIAPGVVSATIAGGGLDAFPNVISASFAPIGGGTLTLPTESGPRLPAAGTTMRSRIILRSGAAGSIPCLPTPALARSAAGMEMPSRPTQPTARSAEDISTSSNRIRATP